MELRCLAPEGIPPPDVSWLRNGLPIEPKKEGSNLIVSNEGHLLVVQARLADMGNYTCVAENVAGRRLSDTAVLTVLGKYTSSEKTSITSISVLTNALYRDPTNCVKKRSIMFTAEK